jgi:dGTPase
MGAMTIIPTLAGCPREQTEAMEAEWLAPEAARSAGSRGRERAEEPCPFRTEYQRDRDRVLHSRAFRRLAAKTQVFVAPRSDHDRTRMTHTLEVCQVARTIARALRLNEDLTEAIALGHDLGHSPYGHSGEAALDAVYKEYDPAGGFRHAAHSLRVVDVLEKDGRGLNLTWEVRDGIRRHSKGDADWPSEGHAAATLEGQLVALCDRIAYSSHDIEDAMTRGLLTQEQFPAFIVSRLGTRHSERLAAMVGDVIAASRDLGGIRMTPEMRDTVNALKSFMYEHLYLSRSMAPRVRTHIHDAITMLFHQYMAVPEDAGLPPNLPLPTRARLVCDHIAGMTDHYADKAYRRVMRGRAEARRGDATTDKG